MQPLVAGIREKRAELLRALFVALFAIGITTAVMFFGKWWGVVVGLVGLAGLLISWFPAGDWKRWLSLIPGVIALSMLVLMTTNVIGDGDRDSVLEDSLSRASDMENRIEFCENRRVHSIRVQIAQKHLDNAHAAIDSNDVYIAEDELEKAETTLPIDVCLN
jgi:hypothetical protein